MTDWGQGYVTDVDYTYGFYRDLAPSFLRLICRLQGVVEPPESLTYLELGCGQGFALNALAAANPTDRFIGVDFMPSQIVGGRRLAEKATLSNIEFIERSFDEVAVNQHSLPPCDVIVVHGVYSWVSAQQRQAIRTIIENQLKPGGLVYITYNCMVGWGSVLPFQRALHDLAMAHGGINSVSEVFKGLKNLAASGLGYFADNPALNKLMSNLENKDSRYFIHEYMNKNWEPMFFQDVDREMRSCKLTFIGSASPAENVEKLSLASEVSHIIRGERDIAMKEFIKDLSLGRRFRKDVYQRGPVRLDAGERISALSRTKFALTKPRSMVEMKAPVPLGILELRRPIYAAALDALETNPQPLDTIASGAELHELVTVLMQTAAIHPCNDQVPSGPARQFNLAISDSTENRERYAFASTPLIGTAIPVPPAMRLVFALCLHDPDADDAVIGERATSMAADPANAPIIQHSSDRLASPEITEGDVALHRRCWKQLRILN